MPIFYSRDMTKYTCTKNNDLWTGFEGNKLNRTSKVGKYFPLVKILTNVLDWVNKVIWKARQYNNISLNTRYIVTLLLLTCLRCPNQIDQESLFQGASHVKYRTDNEALKF